MASDLQRRPDGRPRSHGREPERTVRGHEGGVRRRCLDRRDAAEGFVERARECAAKAPSAEADGFKRWIVGVGKNVAEASNEGGFLGFGGTKVSEAEKQALQAIAQALGVPDAAG
jgi:hypothetical protein